MTTWETTWWTKTKRLIRNFWTKNTPVGRTHTRCLRSRVALKAWDVYHAQKNDIALNVYGQRMCEWAVNSKPWFLAAKFIEAAEVLKEELIQLPADAEIEEDDTLFPPVCLARLNRGRNGVAAAPQGRPRCNRIVRVRRCGNCNEPGHKRSKCRFNSVWFDWNDENDYPFQEVYRRSIPGAQ